MGEDVPKSLFEELKFHTFHVHKNLQHRSMCQLVKMHFMGNIPGVCVHLQNTQDLMLPELFSP